MKILIDESLDVRMKNHFGDYKTFTVKDMEWLGIKNGKLLKLAEENGFTFFITADKNLKYQQNISNLRICILVLNSIDNTISIHLKLIPKILEIIDNVQRKTVIKNYFEIA